MHPVGEPYDVAVVGLGALGSATAWQLARRGRSVLGLERFSFGHVRGASHGDTRIIRLSYHTPNYVSAAIEAYQDWAALESDSAEQLVLRTGGVDLFPPAAAIDIEDYVNSMAVMGVPYQVLTATTARGRWPGLAVPEGTTVLHQELTGIVPAGRGTRVMQEQARRFGADLRDEHQVVELVDLGDGVAIRTAEGTRHFARTVVVTADAWTNDVLASVDASVPLTVTKEQVVHFSVADADEQGRGGRHAQGAFPVWIWMDDPSFYGFPAYFQASVKVGQDCGGQPVDPETRTYETDEDALRRARAFMRVLVPGALDVRTVTTCLYTLTPDRDFVLDRLPGHENVVVGLGSAHGFKFAPWFGRVLADLATTGTSSTDLSAFSLSRRALTDPDAPLTWLV
ncbi:MAG: N-methyl-L-tryptophan oxidase [Actinobacteria bacterium]|nr:N-methyl-L-tryptophan oxidase [Actinomycetota bacterium]